MKLSKVFDQALLSLTTDVGYCPPEWRTPEHKTARAADAKERAQAKRLRKARRGW